MATQYNPKTLAKTLSYISCRALAEHGLFWDPDGSMPWKDFYWVLQEDPTLRFVRESHIREIAYLGLELPFVLDGNLLRLQSLLDRPEYAQAICLPDRLFFACRRRQFVFVREHGIVGSNRPYVPICAERELALRIGRRRDPEPVLLEVLGAAAALEGEVFRLAGPELYLVESIPARHLIFPLLRSDRRAALEVRKKPEARPPAPLLPTAAGSFLVENRHLGNPSGGAKPFDKTGKQKGKKKGDWKREAREERLKRRV